MINLFPTDPSAIHAIAIADFLALSRLYLAATERLVPLGNALPPAKAWTEAFTALTRNVRQLAAATGTVAPKTGIAAVARLAR